MGYIALYRKWRPMVFDDMVEQEHVVRTLKYSVKTGRIAHAYLFCGTRGTGKTTAAHILSRAINCLDPHEGNPCNECEICKGILSGTILDVIEIDAASNNSVDNVREIRGDVVYSPARARYKVYIIDEVHMLSTGAFNALLKTLEEPPSHVVFILATTEPHKLPATILSRCQRFDFRRISIDSIAQRLDKIARSNNVSIKKDALRLIARMAEGALRDAISLLDQCISLGKDNISYDDVMSVIGLVNDFFIADVVDAISSRNTAKVLELVDKLVMNGKDIIQFVSNLVLHYRNLLVCNMIDKPEEIVEASPEMLASMKKQCQALGREELSYIIKELSLLESSLKWSMNPRILLEVALIKLCEGDFSFSADEIQQRLSFLEEKLSLLEAGSRPVALFGGTAAQDPGGIIDQGSKTKEEKGAREVQEENKAGQAGAEKAEAEKAGAEKVGTGKAGVETVEAGKADAETVEVENAESRKAKAQESGPQKAEVGEAKTGEVEAEVEAWEAKEAKQAIPENVISPEKIASARAKNKKQEQGVRLLENWDKVIEELRKNKKMALYTHLLGTNAVLLGQNVLGIIFEGEKASLKSMVSRQPYLETIEKIAAKVLGMEVRVKCLNKEEVNRLIGSAEEEEHTDELVKKASDMASLFGAPLNIIDE